MAAEDGQGRERYWQQARTHPQVLPDILYAEPAVRGQALHLWYVWAGEPMFAISLSAGTPTSARGRSLLRIVAPQGCSSQNTARAYPGKGSSWRLKNMPATATFRKQRQAPPGAALPRQRGIQR